MTGRDNSVQYKAHLQVFSKYTAHIKCFAYAEPVNIVKSYIFENPKLIQKTLQRAFIQTEFFPEHRKHLWE